MRILNLSIIALSFVAGAGTFYLYENFYNIPTQKESVSEVIAPVVPERVPKPAAIYGTCGESVKVQEVPAVAATPVEKIDTPAAKTEEVKAPEKPTVAPVAEDKKAANVQEKVANKVKDNVQEAQKEKESKKEQPKGGMKTLPVEDNFRAKEHKRPGTLGYKHWTGWYYPTKFILTINDTPVITFDDHQFTRPNKELTFDSSKPLKAHFVWEFLHGRKAGWRTTEFELNPDVKSIFIGFDWKDQWQVIIDQAAPIPASDRSSDNKNVEKK